MSGKDELKKIEKVLKHTQDNDCPEKEGDDCKKPGVYGDSKPLGAG